MPVKRGSQGAKELPFHKQLILGLALAFAGTTGTVVAVALPPDATCSQAIELTKDDQLNSALTDQHKTAVATAAADKSVQCLRRK